MNPIVWTAIGTIGAILTSFGFVPQIRKMWQRRSVDDISIGTFFQFTAGASLWAIYGVSRADMIIICANLVTLVSLISGLILYYRFRTAKSN